MATVLEWGQTPFDKMSEGELREHCCRMYSAMTAMYSCLSMSRSVDPKNGYWTDGVGGRALEKGDQTFGLIRQNFDEESIYRSYFRYADDLLFDCTRQPMLGSDWMVCPVCNTMVGNKSRNGQACRDVRGAECTGTFRPFRKSDFDYTQ